ncbi:MAG: histidine--tRNA ligase [Planctomycetes bacterium]|nr:histidine--tRNA ligase [Planctomycetota bacterium]
MAIKAPRGTFDILPDRATLWNRVEAAARKVFHLYGYGEIRTPIFESVKLFASSIGETTDIVEKEMYIFQKGRETYALRPEATASVVRAYIEHNLHKTRAFQKFYYIGPMFRAERPQAGRFRQFHQIGVEAIGSADPLLDAECITMAADLFGELGVGGFTITLNTLGTDESRGRYREVLSLHLRQNRDALCENCRARIERNVFRALDCKVEGCRRITRSGPNVQDHLTDADRESFEKVTNALTGAGVAHEVDGFLVRGLDYYTGLVYEFLHGGLGAQNAICAGGRYDHLVADRGGPDVGATGFALGMERLIMALVDAQRGEAKDPRTPQVMLVNVGDEPRTRIFQLVLELRRRNVAAEMDHEARSTKAQMRAANRLGAPFVAVIGEDELESGRLKIKNMHTGEETPATFDTIADVLTSKLKAPAPKHSES